MKPLPATNVPGDTEAERFSNAVRKMFTVSKETVLNEETKWKQARTKQRKGP
jgi:hypothetical protein